MVGYPSNAAMSVNIIGGGGSGGFGGGTNQQNEMSELCKLELELNSLIADFNRMTNNLENICDRAYGLSPKAEGSKASPVPNGMIETLVNQISYLREIKNKQYDLISRIERIV